MLPLFLFPQAKAIFKQVCPEEEFLPKPPHPDDIIYVNTEEVPAAGNEQGDWATTTAETTDSSETGDITADGQTAAEKDSTQDEQSKAEGKEAVKDGSNEASVEGACAEGMKADAGDAKNCEQISGAGNEDKSGVSCEAES